MQLLCPAATRLGNPIEWLAVLGRIAGDGPVTGLTLTAATRIDPPNQAGPANSAAAGGGAGAAGGGANGAGGLANAGGAAQPAGSSAQAGDGPQPIQVAPPPQITPTAPVRPAERANPAPAAPQPDAQLEAAGRLETFIYSRNRNLPADYRRGIAAELIRQAEAHSMRWEFFAALIAAESNFNPFAVSPTGAMGLGQLMPGTAAGLGVGDPFDIRANLAGAAAYIRRQLDRFADRDATTQFELALASYNAGPAAVDKYGGVPPFSETVNYIYKIASLYTQLCRGGGG
jgi:hypothetical protein